MQHDEDKYRELLHTAYAYARDSISIARDAIIVEGHHKRRLDEHQENMGRNLEMNGGPMMQEKDLGPLAVEIFRYLAHSMQWKV